MEKTAEQLEKDQLEKQWNFDTDFAERMGRFDEALMGKSPDTYRQVPGGTPQANFLKTMDAKLAYFGSHGITSHEFQNAVDKKQRDQEGINLDYDVDQFYKEMEEALKSGKKTGPFVTKPFVMLWRWVHDKTNQTDKDFEKKLNRYHELQTQINGFNAEILALRDDLAALKEVDLVKAVNAKDRAKEEEIRKKISAQQGEIRSAVMKKTNVLGEMKDVQGYKTDVWEAAERELKEEGEKLKKEYGNRVYGIFFNRQQLLNRLKTLNNDQPEQLKLKYEIQEGVNNTDLKLEKIKRAIIKYKAKRPIFLFERLFGTISIPELNRYGQESSEVMKKLWDKEEIPTIVVKTGEKPEQPEPEAVKEEIKTEEPQIKS